MSRCFPLQMKPCQNGGECTITFNDFTCSCLEEYTGKTCETRVWCVSDPCVNGGHCVDLPDGYECKNICIILELWLIINYFANRSALIHTLHPISCLDSETLFLKSNHL